MNRKALAIDIGGTKIYSAVVDETGKITTKIEKFKTPGNLEEIKKTLKYIIEQQEKNVDIVTIATAGAVNLENTKVISSTGNLPLGYKTIDFIMLSSRPVFVENDANCAAYAEHIVGSAKGYANSITITLGTGVGGGIIIENKLLRGKSGAAGEMHFKMSMGKKRKCTCGAWDCFEIYSSGKGLALTAEEILNKKMTSYEIVEGVNAGDKGAKKVLGRWQEYITAGLIGLSNIFDPDCIVLSGSMAQFVDEKSVQESVNKEIIVPDVKILQASAGNYAGMIGSALLGLSKTK